MAPVLHLDPAVKPAAASRALTVLRDQSLQSHQADGPEQVRPDLTLFEGREMDAVDPAGQKLLKAGLAHREGGPNTKSCTSPWEPNGVLVSSRALMNCGE